MSEAIFRRPEIKEVVLQKNEHQFFEIIERSNKIIISEELKELFLEIPIVSFILPRGNLLPQTALTFALVGQGARWHRDYQYPILGIYKPLWVTRVSGTLFTLANGLADLRFSVLSEDTYIRNDYTDQSVSKLTLFSNVAMKDGSYLFHKREAKESTSIFGDRGNNFSIKVENITESEIEYD
jgi:hypothetical protein